MDWTEKHRPRSLADLVGNGPSVAALRKWADAWKAGAMPERRAVILAGSPGTGKTSAALALAHDMQWQVIELNASDSRNAGTIKRIATAGALHHGFSADGSFHGASDAGRKLIILDEADSLYERAGADGKADDGTDMGDKGGKAQIIETIRTTRQPIVLIVNDLYELEKGTGSPLKTLCETLKFQRVQSRSITPALQRICHIEGVEAEREVLEAIAEKAEGDLRSAVRDLQALALGRKKLTRQDLAAMGARDTTSTLFDLVRHILKGRKLEEVKREAGNVDATPEDQVLWIDENLPKEYRDPEDLVRGYEALSRADVFLGRTRRTQNYGLWSYAGEMATLGTMVARRREYRDFVPFGFPSYLSKMGRTRGTRAAKDALAITLGSSTHQSKRKARSGQVEAFATIFQLDREFAIAQSIAMELEDEQIAMLLGDAATAKTLKEIRAGIDAATGNVPEEEGAKKGKSVAAAPRAKQAEEEVAPEAKPEKPKPGVGQKGLFGF